jgi:hypothetical protein
MYCHVNMPIDLNEEGILTMFLHTFIWCVLLSDVGVETEVYLLHGLDILVHDPYPCSAPSMYVVVVHVCCCANVYPKDAHVHCCLPV